MLPTEPFLSAADQHIYVFDSKAKLKHEFKYPDHINTTLAVSLDGTIIAMANNGKYTSLNSVIYLIDPSGKVKHKLKLKGQSSTPPLVAPDQTIIANTYNNIYFIRPNGTIKKRVHMSTLRASISMSASPNNTVVVGTHDGSVYFFTTNGTLKGKYVPEDGGGYKRYYPIKHPTPSNDGSITLSSSDGSIYSFSLTGKNAEERTQIPCAKKHSSL